MRSALLAIFVFLSTTASASVLRVDRATGQVTWENTSGFTIPFFGYWITSESGSLNPDAWLSIADHYDADSGGSLDPDDEWLVFHQRPTIVSESSFTGTAYLSNGQAIDFGTGLWRPGGEDLALVYLDDIVFAENSVPVEYFGTAPQFPPGDYNASGLVEQADLDLVLGNWGATRPVAAAAAVPEPPAAALLAIGLAAVAALGRKRNLTG